MPLSSRSIIVESMSMVRATARSRVSAGTVSSSSDERLLSIDSCRRCNAGWCSRPARISAISASCSCSNTSISQSSTWPQLATPLVWRALWLHSTETILHVHPRCNQHHWHTAAVEGLISDTLHVPSVLWCCWLGGRKGMRPVKNWVVGYWRGYLSGARCRLAYGPADATATRCLLLQ